MSKLIEMPHADVDLKARQGAPWNFVITVRNQDWSGTYTADVRETQSEAGTLVAEPTVTATFDGTDTEFVIELDKTGAEALAVGSYFWDMRETDGAVPFSGRVLIEWTVTP